MFWNVKPGIVMKEENQGLRWNDHEVARMIQQYGNKPTPEEKKELSNQLEECRAVFKAVELNRAREKGRSRGLGL